MVKGTERLLHVKTGAAVLEGMMLTKEKSSANWFRVAAYNRIRVLDWSEEGVVKVHYINKKL